MQTKSLLDVVCVAAPKLAGGACLVLLNLTLMRFLGRELFGAYSLCLAITLLLSEAFFGAAMDMAVLRFAPLHRDQDPAVSIRFEHAALQMKLGFVGALTLILVLGSGPISRWLFHRDDLAHLLSIVGPAALGMLALGTALVHLQVRERFATYGVVDFLAMLIRYGGIGVTLALVANNDQPLAPAMVLIWFAIGPVIAVLAFVIAIAPAFLRQFQWDRTVSLQLIHYVKWILMTSALTSVVARIDLFLVTTLSSAEEVGVLAGAQTIASIPPLLGSYLAVVLSPQVMPRLREGRFFALFWKVQTALIVSSVLAYLLILLNFNLIEQHVLPQSFQPSSRVILILLPASLASMTSFPLVVTFLMFVLPRFLILMECILLPLLLAAYWITTSRYGAVGAAATTASFLIIKTVFALVVTCYWARRPAEELGIRAYP